jgi:1-acyl-sn-glycerol-3-phosphate acyltransferase
MARGAQALAPLVRRLFRARLVGLERLPEGPFLLVANHSAGIGLAELVSFAALYLAQRGPERPLAGFAHPIDFRIAPIARIARQHGVPIVRWGSAAAISRRSARAAAAAARSATSRSATGSPSAPARSPRRRSRCAWPPGARLWTPPR